MVEEHKGKKELSLFRNLSWCNLHCTTTTYYFLLLYCRRPTDKRFPSIFFWNSLQIARKNYLGSELQYFPNEQCIYLRAWNTNHPLSPPFLYLYAHGRRAPKQEKKRQQQAAAALNLKQAETGGKRGRRKYSRDISRGKS